jgi:hypothetical protein
VAADPEIQFWFTGKNVLRLLEGPPPAGWPHVKSIDSVFPGRFEQRSRPDFVWDVFGAPTDLKATWRGGDVAVTWEMAKAIIEVKGLAANFHDRIAAFKPTAACPSEFDYLMLKLRPRLVKADRQIGKARGLVAGDESLGVLVFVNEVFHSLRRVSALAALERIRREHMPNTSLVVYLHDKCRNEPLVHQGADGSPHQVHRVSIVGDPFHRLSRVFLKELKWILTYSLSRAHFPGLVPGILDFDPEKTWGNLHAEQGGWDFDRLLLRQRGGAGSS